MGDFVELADRVYVLRYPVLDVNITLVVGDGAALVVDTLSTAAQADELIDAVRRVTPYPWTLVNTHHHFDHCFGNATLAASNAALAAGGTALAAGGECPIWAHEESATYLREQGAQMRRRIVEYYRTVDPALAEGIAAVQLLLPNRTFHIESTLDIGGRVVQLRYLGRAHTAGDLVARVSDVDVVVAGDIIEESGPPNFRDAYPLEWPDTLAALLPTLAPSTTVIPGHGAPVERDFVTAQHGQLTALAWLIREGHADGAEPEKIAARSPFGPEESLRAVQRGYAELAGRD